MRVTRHLKLWLFSINSDDSPLERKFSSAERGKYREKIPIVFDWLPSCPREKDRFLMGQWTQFQKESLEKKFRASVRTLVQTLWVRMLTCKLGFFQTSFCRKLWWSSSRYSKDILGYVPVADWGILKTNSGREGVKMCKRFCARGLRGSVRPVLRPRAQKRLHIFDSPLLLGGGKKNRRHWPAHFGMWLRQKNVSWDEGQQNGNCQQAATAKIIFRLAAVHGPPRLGISSSQLETGKIYPSWPHRTTS